MTRRNPIRRWIGILVFVAVVAVSGYALAASGNMSNPFRVFSEISNLVASGDQGGERGSEMGFDPSASGESRPEPPSGGFQGEGGRGGGDNQTTIQWSELGSVLFNLWFIAAAAAVMVIVGPILGSLTKRFRPRRRIAPQPAAA